MEPRSSLSRVYRVVLALVAVFPVVACGASDSAPGDEARAGSTSGEAGTAALAGTGPVGSGGTGSAVGGSASVAGATNPVGGTASAAGAAAGGAAGAGGSTMVEVCSLPAWQAGKSYVAGDKVVYMGRAFVANEANPGYDPLISTYFWSPYDCQPLGNGGGSSGGSGPVGSDGDCVLNALLPSGEATFHAMFIPPWQGHVEKPLYSYSALCTALEGFPQFARSGSVEQDRREVAAFFAHVAKETAFLEQTDEAGQPSHSGDFHGRGAIQLTGQANYQAAGDYLQRNLVGNPGLVSTDPLTNWQTALWFWSVHQNPGTAGVQNCHQAISAGDFAQTTRIINGGIECPGSPSAATRGEYFKNNCGLLGVSPGTRLVC